jgi:hypothetical protein
MSINADNIDSVNPPEPLATDSAGTGNKPPTDAGSNISNSANPSPVGFNGGSNDLLPMVDNWQICVRLFFGYLLFLFSLIFVSLLIIFSLSAIDSFQFTSPIPFTYDYVRLAVRGFITLAGVFYCHRVIQVAERMVIPVTLLRNSEDLKLLLAVNSRIQEPLEYIKGVVKIIKSLKE